MPAESSKSSAALAHAKAAHDAGHFDVAVLRYKAVLAEDSRHGEALYLLGLALVSAGRADEALATFERLITLFPGVALAWIARGNALSNAGRATEAIASFARGCALEPDNPLAREKYGSLLFGQQDYAGAVREFEVVTRLRPESPDALNNLASALSSLGRFADALACFERALTLDANHAGALLNSLFALERMGRSFEAVQRGRRLLAAHPVVAAYHCRVGRLLFDQGYFEEAHAAINRALELDPEDVESRWAQAMYVLPSVYGPDMEAERYRQQWDRALVDLDAWFDDRRAPRGFRAVGTTHPYYLVYHETDNTAAASHYGDLCRRLMAASGLERTLPVRTSTRAGPVRLAIVSSYFYDHSVWTALVRGFCAELDPDQVELHLCHTGPINDAETVTARACAAGFHTGVGSLDRWVAELARMRSSIRRSAWM